MKHLKNVAPLWDLFTIHKIGSQYYLNLNVGCIDINTLERCDSSLEGNIIGKPKLYLDLPVLNLQSIIRLKNGLYAYVWLIIPNHIFSVIAIDELGEIRRLIAGDFDIIGYVDTEEYDFINNCNYS